MDKSILLCLADGSEETEAVTTFDLLVRAGMQVRAASVNGDGGLTIVGSRGVRLLADAPLAPLAEQPFDAIVLPSDMQGAECFQRSPLLLECVRRMHLDGKLVAAICAAPALVLQHHQLFSQAYMTGFPALKDRIPADRWVDQRVVHDARYRLLTSQGPGTAMDFALNIIALLCGLPAAAEVAAEVAAQVSTTPGHCKFSRLAMYQTRGSASAGRICRRGLQKACSRCRTTWAAGQDTTRGRRGPHSRWKRPPAI
ncbi:4-methyl-5(beta-hydroxyethyl)-thiazole synthesis [Sodalis glossinidius str. 'morsitans']|uniref:4-methyl-5(Beta-hydroxyethyl)-thiazole synthesis n=1 Tax=Sodalis glossinidius (strain morsitans) TaxID=343509 RepID=Q2NV90_SODGM|nr:protein deglycase YajL [Sodalis glossinidius]BAE73935.1 4-methyl-5(beta-hydroxyethyl)-thiazole synthesis [Sodalis glossinidius str. 'morsitans']